MISHEGLDAWKISRELAVIFLRLSCDRWRPWAAALFDQGLRASLSVQLNIAEGYAFGRAPSRLRHYRVAYGSALETGEICDLFRETGIVEGEEAEALLALSVRSRELCWGLVRSELGNQAKRETKAGTP
jgi:four helix bundle protein